MNTFESHINGAIPVVVEFYAEWSEPSKLMAPVMQEVKETAGERAITLKIDIDQYPELAHQYGVYTVPSVAIFKEGNIIWHKKGITPAREILEHLLLELK
jgi:thioredoxin 1